MFDNNIKVLRWLLILSCISLIYAVGFFNSEDDQERKLECMQELEVSAEMVKEMEDADDPKDEYSCFFGCMAFKEGIISEDGQLIRATADANIAETDDENEKTIIQASFKVLADNLKRTNDTCSAGLIFQTMMYQMKKLVKIVKGME